MAETLNEAVENLTPHQNAHASEILAAEEQNDKLEDLVETDYTASMWSEPDQDQHLHHRSCFRLTKSATPAAATPLTIAELKPTSSWAGRRTRLLLPARLISTQREGHAGSPPLKLPSKLSATTRTTTMPLRRMRSRKAIDECDVHHRPLRRRVRHQVQGCCSPSTVSTMRDYRRQGPDPEVRHHRRYPGC